MYWKLRPQRNTTKFQTVGKDRHKPPKQYNNCYEKNIPGIKDTMRTQKKKCTILPGDVRNTQS